MAGYGLTNPPVAKTRKSLKPLAPKVAGSGNLPYSSNPNNVPSGFIPGASMAKQTVSDPYLDKLKASFDPSLVPKYDWTTPAGMARADDIGVREALNVQRQQDATNRLRALIRK
jgi:hypothetical protein